MLSEIVSRDVFNCCWGTALTSSNENRGRDKSLGDESGNRDDHDELI